MLKPRKSVRFCVYMVRTYLLPAEGKVVAGYEVHTFWIGTKPAARAVLQTFRRRGLLRDGARLAGSSRG